MPDLNVLDTHAALVSSLESLHHDVSSFYAAILPADFFAGSAESWSPADNLDHLLKAHRPVVKALTLPKAILERKFGAATEPSRSFAEIREAYLRMIAQGAQAFGQYLPAPADLTAGAEVVKSGLLEQWIQSGRGLVDQVTLWSEPDLDHYRLPHPLLGPLTLREMLFFTLYHSRRHLTPAGD